MLFKVNDFDFKIYVSVEREKINPFNSQFPIILKKNNTEFLISISPNFNINNLEENIKDHNSNLSINHLNFNFLTDLFDCNLLSVNRYIFQTIKTDSNNDEKIFRTLNESEINKFLKICSIPKSNILKLNSENKIFLNIKSNEIMGYGFINRETKEFVEISVATTKSERKNGFGYETVKRMTNEIKKTGKTIIYITQDKNVASNRIVTKCGYKFLTKELMGFRTVCV